MKHLPSNSATRKRLATVKELIGASAPFKSFKPFNRALRSSRSPAGGDGIYPTAPSCKRLPQR